MALRVSRRAPSEALQRVFDVAVPIQVLSIHHEYVYGFDVFVNYELAHLLQPIDDRILQRLLELSVHEKDYDRHTTTPPNMRKRTSAMQHTFLGELFTDSFYWRLRAGHVARPHLLEQLLDQAHAYNGMSFGDTFCPVDDWLPKVEYKDNINHHLRLQRSLQAELRHIAARKAPAVDPRGIEDIQFLEKAAELRKETVDALVSQVSAQSNHTHTCSSSPRTSPAADPIVFLTVCTPAATPAPTRPTDQPAP